MANKELNEEVYRTALRQARVDLDASSERLRELDVQRSDIEADARNVRVLIRNLCTILGEDSGFTVEEDAPVRKRKAATA